MIMEKTTKVYEKVLEETCNCYAHPLTGNRPCDEGAPCNKCDADWVQEVFRARLKKTCRYPGKSENACHPKGCEFCEAYMSDEEWGE
jgi:hypothetical protein